MFEKNISTSYGIYAIYCKTTNKYYIGQTRAKGGFKTRWNTHIRELNKGRHHSQKLQSAWNKHGQDAFKLLILFETTDRTTSNNYLDPLEIKFIAEYNAFNNGYNLTTGGTGGRVCSEETKKLIGNHNRGKIISVEQRAAISKANRGKTLSEETKARMAVSAKGKHHGPQSEEAKAKIALSNKTRACRFATQEHKDKISKALTGKVGRPWTEKQRAAHILKRTGTKQSEETKEKMRQAWVKRKAKLVS